MALSEEVVEDYRRSLRDLNFNSKPLINMLTMLADDHEQHASEIVAVIEEHLIKCRPEKKLPALYLMDSIMKNLEKSSYKSLFARNIVQTFTSVFEQSLIDSLYFNIYINVLFPDVERQVFKKGTSDWEPRLQYLVTEDGQLGRPRCSKVCSFEKM